MPPLRILLVSALGALLHADEAGPLADVLAWPTAHAPAPAADQDPDEPPSADGTGQVWFGKRVAVDTWDIVSSPFDWSGKEWAVAGGAVGGTLFTALFLDRHFQSDSQAQRTDDKDRWSGAWGQLGTFYSVGVLGAAGAYGWLADDERGVNVMVDGVEATVIASGILCPVLKYTVGRSRPNQSGQDSDNFNPFSGDGSFPSGHTTQAFTVASVLAFSFEDQPALGALAFTLASGVGLSRINDNMHYASDVVAGAVLGTWVGYEVVHFNRRRRGEEERSRGITDPTWDLILTGDRRGISLTWRW